MERLLRAAGSARLWRWAASRRPVVLLYHGVPEQPLLAGDLHRQAFEKHVRHLASEFECVPLREVLGTRKLSDRPQVHLTFDDGFRNNLTCVAPVLRSLGVPASFYVCSRPTQNGRYLWFVHLRVLEARYAESTLEFRGTLLDMRPEARRATIAQLTRALLALRPHPEALYAALEELPQPESLLTEAERQDVCAGMSDDEIAQLDRDPLFEVELHTRDHPFLSRCTADMQRQQIASQMAHLSEVCGRPCRALAYPSGDYDRRTLELAREFRLSFGFAVDASGRGGSPYEIPRLGIYSESTGALAVKALWGTRLRAMRVRVG